MFFFFLFNIILTMTWQKNLLETFSSQVLWITVWTMADRNWALTEDWMDWLTSACWAKVLCFGTAFWFFLLLIFMFGSRTKHKLDKPLDWQDCTEIINC